MRTLIALAFVTFASLFFAGTASACDKPIKAVNQDISVTFQTVKTRCHDLTVEKVAFCSQGGQKATRCITHNAAAWEQACRQARRKMGSNWNCDRIKKVAFKQGGGFVYDDKSRVTVYLSVSGPSAVLNLGGVPE